MDYCNDCEKKIEHIYYLLEFENLKQTNSILKFLLANNILCESCISEVNGYFEFYDNILKLVRLKNEFTKKYNLKYSPFKEYDLSSIPIFERGYFWQLEYDITDLEEEVNSYLENYDLDWEDVVVSNNIC